MLNNVSHGYHESLLCLLYVQIASIGLDRIAQLSLSSVYALYKHNFCKPTVSIEDQQCGTMW